jgi:bud site selection protein 20
LLTKHVCRLKLLREGVFDHKAAADAIGYRTDNGPEKTKTQDIEMA